MELGDRYGAPEQSAKLFIATSLEGPWSFAVGVVHSSSYFSSYDHNIRIDSSTVLNANIGYETGKWKAMLSLENLTEEDYFIGSQRNALVYRFEGCASRECFVGIVAE